MKNINIQSKKFNEYEDRIKELIRAERAANNKGTNPNIEYFLRDLKDDKSLTPIEKIRILRRKPEKIDWDLGMCIALYHDSSVCKQYLDLVTELNSKNPAKIWKLLQLKTNNNETLGTQIACSQDEEINRQFLKLLEKIYSNNKITPAEKLALLNLQAAGGMTFGMHIAQRLDADTIKQYLALASSLLENQNININININDKLAFLNRRNENNMKLGMLIASNPYGAEAIPEYLLFLTKIWQITNIKNNEKLIFLKLQDRDNHYTLGMLIAISVNQESIKQYFNLLAAIWQDNTISNQEKLSLLNLPDKEKSTFGLHIADKGNDANIQQYLSLLETTWQDDTISSLEKLAFLKWQNNIGMTLGMYIAHNSTIAIAKYLALITRILQDKKISGSDKFNFLMLKDNGNLTFTHHMAAKQQADINLQHLDCLNTLNDIDLSNKLELLTADKLSTFMAQYQNEEVNKKYLGILNDSLLSILLKNENKSNYLKEKLPAILLELREVINICSNINIKKMYISIFCRQVLLLLVTCPNISNEAEFKNSINELAQQDHEDALQVQAKLAFCEISWEEKLYELALAGNDKALEFLIKSLELDREDNKKYIFDCINHRLADIEKLASEVDKNINKNSSNQAVENIYTNFAANSAPSAPPAPESTDNNPINILNKKIANLRLLFDKFPEEYNDETIKLEMKLNKIRNYQATEKKIIFL
jgi:hypothetical protein